MKALVTGGGGFLGGAIARMLHERGDQVTVLGRHRYPHIERLGIGAIQGDLRDREAVCRAVEGVEVVFHAGAVPGIWGPRRMFWDINVGGTRNVLAACRETGVAKLVYTSSPSVVFGEGELCGVDESVPYPDRYLADYPETKAVAEREVLAADDQTLSTVSLRPHLIWGPGDPHLIPRVLDRARRGRLMQVGDGCNLVDIIYIDNAAEAHLLAADALGPGAACAGRAYFISQGKPVALWRWLNEIIEAMSIAPVRRTIRYKTAYRLGAVFEVLYSLAGRSTKREPPMTRFLAAQLAKSHYFDISAAKRDFGYAPRVTTAEGVECLLTWLRGVMV
ncbi:MAG: NAD-dependent epimerase/dehydratase family protein [Phycisphaerae bacterium]|nr:NAD-dependent epimerase/dehydratase family protein [Phycisphaerae bacterium]